MAERRMFSKRVVCSARFMKMPISSQCLYFYLGIAADDDGVVEAYPIVQSSNATEDDLKILVAKGFVKVLNEDLVTYITDWNENNKIRADRKIDSIYKDLLLQMNPEVKLVEAKKRKDNELRSKAHMESELPYKFSGVIRGLFYSDRCPICSCRMTDGNTKPSIQHNIPISKGGKHEIDNISVICLSCNMSLKDKETSDLNNQKVKERWNNYIESNNEDSLRTTIGQHEDSIGKDRIGEYNLKTLMSSSDEPTCQSDGDFEDKKTVNTVNTVTKERDTVDEKQLKHDFELIYQQYPKKKGADKHKAFELYKQWVSKKGKYVRGKYYHLTNKQIWLAVKKYVSEQESDDKDYIYWKNFVTLMGESILSYIEDLE